MKEYEKEIKIIGKFYERYEVNPTIEKEYEKLYTEPYPDALSGRSCSWWRTYKRKEVCTVEELFEEKGFEEVLRDFSRKVFDKGKREVLDNLGKYIQVK